MRVKDTEPSQPVKPAPDRARFQQALHQARGPQPAAASRPPGAPPKPAGTPASAPRPSASATGIGKPAASPPKPLTAISTGKVIVQSRGALAAPENLGRVRQGMHVEVQRLHHTRTEAQSIAREHTEHRVTELIARELVRDLRAEPGNAAGAPRSPTLPPSEPARASHTGALAPAGEPRLGGVSPGTPPPEAPDAQLKAKAALELIERIEVFVKSQRPALKLSLGGALDATVEVERTGPREVALRIQGRHGPVPSEELSRIRDALEARGLRLRTLLAG